MEVLFSKHAIAQMRARQISKVIANKILKAPSQVIEKDGYRIYQSIISDKGKNYLIRIFVNHNKHPNLVITAYKTSKTGKYYEGEI